jgi:hypothetical protein
MSPNPPATTTELEWFIRTIYLAGLAVPVARLRFRIHFPTNVPSVPAMAEWCWFDSGAPLAVIPYSVHSQGLAWKPLPGVQTTWAGQLCDIGHIGIWLPVKNPPGLRGPFSLLAKFPHSSPPGVPVSILLGLEFLLTYQAACGIWPPPRQGILEVP